MIRKVALLLSLAGLLVSGYLALAHWLGLTAVCSGSGCDEVQQSAYAQVGSIPTAMFGCVYYLTLTVLILWEWVVGRNSRLVSFSLGLTWAAAVISLGLTYVEAFVLYSYCLWCLVSAGLCLLLVPVMTQVRKRDEVERNPALTGYLRDRKFIMVLLTVSAFTSYRGVVVLKSKVQPAQGTVSLSQLIASGSHALGDPKARHTIVEFSDFGCPNCEVQYKTVRRFMREAPHNVRWVYRHQPLRMHKRSWEASLAAEAAAVQGRFFEMADLLFKNRPKFSQEELESYARELGLDLDRFRKDMKKSAVRDRVVRDTSTAAFLGVKAVPTAYVDGRLHRSNLTQKELIAISRMPALPEVKSEGTTRTGARQRSEVPQPAM
ncbi:MAG: vitamin K epoxide reductase family protein [Armatimonadetes bacterium]|nr:vitamin K epoxide reductase family protein [Armatimonadota bacterium]